MYRVLYIGSNKCYLKLSGCSLIQTYTWYSNTQNLNSWCDCQSKVARLGYSAHYNLNLNYFYQKCTAFDRIYISHQLFGFIMGLKNGCLLSVIDDALQVSTVCLIRRVLASLYPLFQCFQEIYVIFFRSKSYHYQQIGTFLWLKKENKPTQADDEVRQYHRNHHQSRRECFHYMFKRANNNNRHFY